jgi:tetratricopeptide (TPR) repeat protein
MPRTGRGSTTPATPATAAPAQGVPVKAPVVASPIVITPAREAPAEAGKSGEATSTPPDRAQAYYHFALANTYEDDAITEGHPEFLTLAIEEYKLALNVDPNSVQVNLALADLYYRTVRVHEAESVARAMLKSAPDNIDAHKLLGRIYLRVVERRAKCSFLRFSRRQCA